MNLRTETNVKALRQAALLMDAELRRLQSVLRQKCETIDALTGKSGDLQATLELLGKMTTADGRPDTSVPPASPAPLFDADGAEQPEVEVPPAPKAKRRGHGPTPQPRLKPIERVYELDEADRVCTQCGGGLAEMTGKFESSEMIDVVEARYELVVVQRQKYACKCGGCVETALGPDRIIEGGRFSLEFAAKVAGDKYAHNVPLTRQATMMGFAGLDVSAQTLFDQCHALAKLCKPTWEAIRRSILESPVLGLDQTGWPDLAKKGNKRKQIWCLTAPGLVYHCIYDDKATQTFNQVVGGYRGVVVCDAMASHKAGARAGPGLRLAYCWAHVLRKFRDALPSAAEASAPLFIIGWMYDVERDADDDVERLALRQAVSKVLLEELHGWLRAAQNRYPKGIALREAIDYVLNHWVQLALFVQDPAIWIDNNPTERGLRGACVGRRVHFGSKSKRGTETAAILYSMVETAKLHGINPNAYLAAVARAAKANPGAVLMPKDFVEG